MRNSLLNVTLALVLVSLAGWLLVVGRALLLPFVTALIVWYLINALASGLRAVPLGPWRLPALPALLMALVLIFVAGTFIFDLVAANLTQLARDTPAYQTRLEEVFASLSALAGLQEPVQMRDLMPQTSLTQLVTQAASFITTMAGSASLVFIYVLFLLIEQSTFDRKYAALFDSEGQAERAFAIRAEINRRVLHYFGIKTGVSLATGLATTGLLMLAGLPYAALFGFIAFLLNYIPTIGSLISVIFPSVLALVYFDTFAPFLAISIGLGVIQFALGNLVEPKLMGSSLNLSGLVILLSLAFWGAIWGVTGMVLCVPLTVVILIICAEIPQTRAIAVLLSADGNVGPPLQHRQTPAGETAQSRG